MLLSILIFAALVLTVSGYAIRKPVLAISSALFWLLSGVCAYTQSTQDWTNWDVYLGVAFGCLIFTIVAMLSPLALREKHEDLEETIEKRSDFAEFQEEFGEMGMGLHAMTGGSRPSILSNNEQQQVALGQSMLAKRREKSLQRYKEGI